MLRVALAILAVALATGRPIDSQPTVLPAAVRSALDRLHPGWRIAGISSEVREQVGPDLGKTPNVIIGDFDGNGRPDVAMLVEYPKTDASEKTFTHYLEALAFLNSGRGFVRFELRERSGAPNPDLYLTLRKRGARGFDFVANRKFTFAHDSIAECWFGKASGTYIYEHGRFRLVTESD